MAEFTKELQQIIVRHEGVSFENDKRDQPTKYGVIKDDIIKCVKDGIIPLHMVTNGYSIDVASKADFIKYIKYLDYDIAMKIIKYLYFDQLFLNRIIYQNIANKICDMALPLGIYGATLCAQRAFRGINILSLPPLIEDSIMGNKTLSAINLCGENVFLNPYKSECAGEFRIRALKNPKKECYLSGWLNRAYE